MSRVPITVSLVLGSGGARGLAHIGVIQWLTENGYAIGSISGSSMGALVGGIHAAHKLDRYTEWVMALERRHVLRLLDPAIGRPGLFKGERVMGVLRELIGDSDIEALPIAFTAVATDLDSGQEVWLREGRLFDAVRASIATPMVFTPFKLGGRTLIDGAVVNPLPVAPTLYNATALTIAVDLSGPAELLALARPAKRGLLNVAFAAMQTMQDTITDLRLSAVAPDVLIKIPRDACGFFEYWRAEEMITLGRQRAEAALAG
jgi:NTE family protein